VTESPINVVLVDDHAIVRTGFRLLLENSSDIRVIAELDSGEAINQRAVELRPDVIVMDLSMPGMGGLEAIRRIKAKSAAIRILVFTMHDSIAFVEQALEAGASGYITKNNAPKVLLEAIRKIASGGTYIDEKLVDKLSMKDNLGSGTPLGNLSRREFQIFCKFAEGKNASDIADDLSLSVKTVANYQTQIKEKLGITSTAELVKLAIAHGIIQM
jgi:two-component system, NarL family, invasion response regulator UvrY